MIRKPHTCVILVFALVLTIAVTYGPAASADEGAVVAQLTTSCSVQEVIGTHNATASNYAANGRCLFYGGGRLFEDRAVNWTVKGSHQPNTKATFETLALRYVESGQERDSGSMSSTMQCGSDPWRLPSGAPCRFVKRQTSPLSLAGEVSIAYQELVEKAPTVPLSALLSPSQRAGLQRQYDIAIAKHQKFDRSGTSVLRTRPPATGPVAAGNETTPSAFPTAPTINSPTPNGYLVKGKGVFKITPSKYLTGTHANYQLRWLNPPASYQGKGLDFYNLELPMTLIAGPTGLPVPQTLLAQGSWEIRVRINQPKVGDWSDWVRFEYYLQDPAIAPKADVQFGVEGQKKGGTTGTGTSAFRSQSTPQQGMGAGPTLIRPRGVEDESATPNEQSPAAETQP